MNLAQTCFKSFIFIFLLIAVVPVYAQQTITKFAVYDIATKTPISGLDPLPAGATIDLSKYSGKRLNVRVFTSPTTVGSVRFDLNSTTSFHIENTSPYYLYGDSGEVGNLTAGSYNLIATPFTLSKATGTAGASSSIQFQVINGTSTPTPTPTSTPAPTATPLTSYSTTLYNPIELKFQGPLQGPKDAPARDISLRVDFRHESGSPTISMHGFWDGDGNGGLTGDVFIVRFAPTKIGKWELLTVSSNDSRLNGQNQGKIVTVTSSSHKGFWLPDTATPGSRYYKRTDGSHTHVVGNTIYYLLSEWKNTGSTGPRIASDVSGVSGYYNKLRFSINNNNLYPNPNEKPWLNDSGVPTDDGNFSHRPNPRWFRQRTDLAVKTAFSKDMIADIIIAGPDGDKPRSVLKAKSNGGDNTPILRYLAARYGAYPNVWFCLANEFTNPNENINYSTSEIVSAGNKLKSFLPNKNPLSVHSYPGSWNTALNTSPSWNDHVIFQQKLKVLATAADKMIAGYAAGGSRMPVMNDELGYQGAGDNYSEGDILEAHVGAFVGGGFGSTAYKSGNKQGQYMWGGFNATEHSASDNLLWMRQRINANMQHWRYTPVALASSIFTNTSTSSRATQLAGSEYVLATKEAKLGIRANLPSGVWQVKRINVVSKSETTLSTSATGAFTFDAPSSRAVLFHFKKVQ